MSSGSLNAPALAELCQLLERPEGQILPDALWLSGKRPLYQHLRELGALGLAQQPVAAVTCPGCACHFIRPERPSTPNGPYRAYCLDCGGFDLAPEEVRPWQAYPAKLADWLNSTLGLKARHPVTPLIPRVLWHLGEREFRRYQRSFFFGCRLAEAPDAVLAAVARRAAPGAGVVITTTDLGELPNPSPCRWVPFQAVAHLRKSALELENLEAYFDEPPGEPPPAEPSNETSLRLLHSHRVALINGQPIKVSRQVYRFLKVLLDADGDEVDKEAIATELNIKPTFKPAEIFKRHRLVLDTFIQFDQKGQFWLRPEFLLINDA